MKSESTLPRRTSPLTWWTSTRPPPLLTIFIGSNPCLLPSLHIWSKCWILLQILHFMLNRPEWWLKIRLSRKFSQDDMYWKCVGSYIWFPILCQLLCTSMWNLFSEKIKRIVLSLWNSIFILVMVGWWSKLLMWIPEIFLLIPLIKCKSYLKMNWGSRYLTYSRI